MKERGILFTGRMVRAILDDKKTQTRRIVKPAPTQLEQHTNWPLHYHEGPDGIKTGFHRYACPYGQPDDRLWVKETFSPCGECEDHPSFHVLYRADAERALGAYGAVKWKPAIFMPRRYSRITLEITDVRIERLQKITWLDAIAEGIRDPRRAEKRIDPIYGCVAQYRELWTEINGKGSWEQNPFVWVIEFRRLFIYRHDLTESKTLATDSGCTSKDSTPRNPATA